MEGINWLGFWIFMGVLAFGVTSCTKEAVHIEAKSDFILCTQSCPKSFVGEFENLECPIMCGDIVSKLTSNSTSLTSAKAEET